MTLEQTRQLGIEFERRVQIMIPEKEYLEKLDSETIYSFLNQYQDKYIHEIYRNLDKMESGSNMTSSVESVLQCLLKEQEIKVTSAYNNTTSIYDPNSIVVSTGRSVTYPLDPAFYMYVRSVSKVSSTFNFKSSSNDEIHPLRVIPNKLVSQSDVWKLIETPHNTLRILRYPAAVYTPHTKTGKPTLTVIYDQYTTPEAINVTYFVQPKPFDIMTSTPCELPFESFDDIVSGAVDLYIQYVAGAEANRKRQQEAARKAAKESSNNNRQNESEE